MPRLDLTPETQVPPNMRSRYAQVTATQSGLADTFQALFANPHVANGLAGLDELVGQSDLEPWIKYTVALAVLTSKIAPTFGTLLSRWPVRPGYETRSLTPSPRAPRPEACCPKKAYGSTSR